jgi:hypothetical protein
MTISLRRTQVILALFGLFAFFFLVLTVWCFVIFIQDRVHRSLFAFLLPALILSVLGNANNIALQVSDNLSPRAPPKLALEVIELLSTNWAISFLYLLVIEVHRNRERAIFAATDGTFSRHSRSFTVVYMVLTVLLFVLGTMYAAVYAATLTIYRYMEYSFKSCVVLTGIFVVVSTVLLWGAGRAAGIKDKVYYVYGAIYADIDRRSPVRQTILSSSLSPRYMQPIVYSP